MHHIRVFCYSASPIYFSVPLTPSRAQELCESRRGRPGLPVPTKPYGLWDVKHHERRRLTGLLSWLLLLFCVCVFFGFSSKQVRGSNVNS